MSKPVKILELSNNDWMKGLSAHAGLPIGGIFQSAAEFDPFSLPGYLRGSISPTDVDTTTLSTQTNAMASGASGGVGYIVAVGNRASGGAKCVYLINTSTNAVTDQKANVDSSLLLNGAAIWGGYVIYADGTDTAIKSVTFPAFGSDTAIEVPTGMSVTNQPVVFRVGPSGYLHYFRGSSNGQVGVITVPSSNHANNIDNSVIVQTDLTPKDGCTDGRYFVVIADNNPTRATGVSSDCKVFFTVPAFVAGVPSSTSTWEHSWTIPDQYLISCRYVDGVIRIIGYSGIWECSIGMSPRLVMPLTSSQLPTNPYFVDLTTKNIMVWASSAIGATVFAYGNPFGGKPALFTPYDSSSSTGLHTCLVVSGDYIYAGLDGNGGATIKTIAHNYGASRANPTIRTIAQHLPQPYKLSYVKVNLKKPLASGEVLDVNMYNANDEEILDQSKSFTTYGALRTIVYEPLPNATTPLLSFENFYLQVNPQGGAIVDTVQVWGIPLDSHLQTK